MAKNAAEFEKRTDPFGFCVAGRGPRSIVGALRPGRMITVHENDFFIQPGYGASLDTLLKRVSYGGRKGRRAAIRIDRNTRRLNPRTT
jgi:hypothetical protein